MKLIEIPDLSMLASLKNQMLSQIISFFEDYKGLQISVGKITLYYGDWYDEINEDGVLDTPSGCRILYKDLCINDLEFVCEQINEYIKSETQE